MTVIRCGQVTRSATTSAVRRRLGSLLLLLLVTGVVWAALRWVLR
jgi:hypothetical protein